ncbi:enoyl-CoA hydratase/isomerase family protein [Rhodoligotrophos ferricapiens]|uniref:enoyl-CoA hydratase/isomerase family protein n=1 Tax=Rhodoligotrophos ferricapiens TaxID=3069264 RepID=UPI00315C652C
MSEQVVVSDVRKGALWLRLNRPDAMNALSPAVLTGINGALDKVEHDPEVKAVVLTGTGRAFSAGADLKYLRGEVGGDSGKMHDFLSQVIGTMERLERFPRPVIAAVNGMALAGGLELVLCCDLVIAARSAKLGDAHANYGLLPGGGGSVRLPRKIGPTRAKYLLYTGEFVPAEELVTCGLVNEVVEDEDLIPAAERLIAKMATKSSLVLRRMKALVDDGLEQPSATALRLELIAGEVHATSHDMNEGLAAFQEKRKPRFIGR